MPIMTRMRDNMPMILFGLLIAFLITIVFDWGMGYFGLRGSDRADLLGKVNGEKISYREFTNLVKNMSDNQKAQSGQDPDENQLKQIREQAWQSLVTQVLIEEQIRKLGLTVTDQEIIEWVRGDNPPEDLRRNFIDSAGQFRKDLYDEFLNNPSQFFRESQSDPEYGTRWLAQYEHSLRQRRLQEKLQSVIAASVRVGEEELRERFDDQHRRYDAKYAFLDPATFVKDDEIQAGDADLKSFYEENLDQYKVDASRKLNYVIFPERPSSADSTGRVQDVNEALTKARAGEDFIQLVYMYSEKPDSGAYFHHGELSPTLDSAVFSSPVGSIVGPVSDRDGLHLVKILDQRNGPQEYVHASHILITPSAYQDTNEARRVVANVLKSARAGENFADLARTYSRDPGSAAQGGDLGWFPKGRMAPAFEAAAFRGKPGEIVGPVRTQFGFHIIKVLGKDSKELKLANILMHITASSQTKNDIMERARDFSYLAKSSEFVKEAQGMGFEVHETQIQDKSGVIPGVGINESISRWAFNNKVGAVSEPFETQNGYAVFGVTEVREAGVRPFEEVKESLKPQVQRKKRLDRVTQIAADLRAKLSSSDSLSRLTDLNPAVRIQDTGPFTMGGSVPMIGRDQAFLGTVLGLKVGQISPAIEGLRGAYIIELGSRSDFDSTAYAQQREQLLSRMLQEKRGRFVSDWIAKLKERADIEDNREMFRM